VKRSTTVALAAASATALLLAAAQPASAGGNGAGSHRGHGHGAAVTGTYSTGANAAWVSLPTTHVGADDGEPTGSTVVVDPSQLRQQYNGMGFSIDETAVSNYWKLTPAEREKAVKLLVDPKTGAGFDRFRLTIGSPDLIEHLPFWSEDDLPPGVTSDWNLKYFSLQRDEDLHIVDMVKLIQKYNPHAMFFASAWSAPAWMKTNNQFTGQVALVPGSTDTYYQVGKLRDDAIDVFARYYAKYVQAYARLGVHIDAITLLNEPGIDVVYPAMDISIPQQQKLAVAIKKAFRENHLSTQLWVHDFNFYDWKNPDSTETKNYWRIFQDPATEKAADSIAFHPYWGDPSVMRDAFEQYHKPVQMTETSDLSPSTVLQYFRLDASSYVLWAQNTDQNGGTLHWTGDRDNNVNWDEVAANDHWTDRLVTTDTETKTFSVRDELYTLGQFSKYLTPADTRVESSAASGGVSNVVYRDGDKFTAILGNDNATPTSVRVLLGDQSFVVNVPASSYATYIWKADVPSAHRNHAPVLAPAAPVTADQYVTTSFQLKATDRDHDRLAYYATDLPAGVTLDARTGLVTVHPTKSGDQTLTFYVTDGAARASTTVHLTVAPHGAPIGERIEAEAYVGENGWTDGGANFVESTGGTSGGQDVGWTAAGNWLQYRIDVAAAGTYDLELRVANGTGAAAPDAISFRDAAGNTLATASVPDTGAWTSYVSVHVPVTLAAGDQVVTVYCNTGGFNLDYLQLT
jgi:glucosylceramidase